MGLVLNALGELISVWGSQATHGAAAHQYLVHELSIAEMIMDTAKRSLLQHHSPFYHSLMQKNLTMGLMQINDENTSPLYGANVAKYAGKDGMGGLNEEDFTTANLKHAINGRLFCNLEGLTMDSGQKIRWHTAVLVGSPPLPTAQYNLLPVVLACDVQIARLH